MWIVLIVKNTTLRTNKDKETYKAPTKSKRDLYDILILWELYFRREIKYYFFKFCHNASERNCNEIYCHLGECRLLF